MYCVQIVSSGGRLSCSEGEWEANETIIKIINGSRDRRATIKLSFSRNSASVAAAAFYSKVAVERMYLTACYLPSSDCPLALLRNVCFIYTLGVAATIAIDSKMCYNRINKSCAACTKCFNLFGFFLES